MASTPSSYIPTSGSTVTRAAETLTIDSTLLPYSSTAMSIAMRGGISWADDPGTTDAVLLRWFADGSNRIFWEARVDYALFAQTYSGTTDLVIGNSFPDPGVNQSFSIASRHEDGSINGAVDGTALTADNTPTALPDLSATDMQVAYDFMGTVGRFLMWGLTIQDAGMEEASDP